MSGKEKRIANFIAENLWAVVMLLSLAGGITARLQGIYLISGDYILYLEPWMKTLHAYGGFPGLALNFSDYYIPYLCILAIGSNLGPDSWLVYIKIISMISELFFAASSFLLAKRLLREQGLDEDWASAVFAVCMLSPMVVLNGAFWGQCDYIYASFCVLCIYFLVGKRYTASLNMLGIAVIFKQQALFLLPVLVLVWLLNRSFSGLKFLYIPMWYLLGGLPAIFAGRPAGDVYSIYLGQAGEYHKLTMNLPNLYSFFPNNKKDDFFAWGIMATAVILLILALWAAGSKLRLSSRAILGLAMCSSGICGMFLPALHERYLVLYVSFAYIYYLVYCKKKTFLPGILDALVCITYFYFLYGVDLRDRYPVLAAIHMAVLFYIIYDTTCIMKQENS